jgi:hypothetical protein
MEVTMDLEQNSIREVISKLKFISKIKQGEKIDTKNYLLMEDGLYTRVYRKYMGLNKEDTLEFVNVLMKEAFGVCKFYRDEKQDSFHKGMLKLLMSSIKEARRGLENLELTYAQDRMFTSKIETLIKTLDVKLEQLDWTT